VKMKMKLICLAMPPLIAVVISVFTLPLRQDHVGLILASLVSGGFSYCSLTNLKTGHFTSQQGNYSRSYTPFRYWLYSLLVLGFTIFALVYFLYQACIVIQTP